MRNRNNGLGILGGGCGCYLTVIVINLTFGAWCFSYSLNSFFGKDAPWYLDVVGGLFLGELTIPLAVVCFILNSIGVHTPYFPQ